MPDYELSQQGKTVLQMTRDGLTSENVASGETENVSHKKTDYEYHKQGEIEDAYNEGNQNDYFNSQDLNAENQSQASSNTNTVITEDEEDAIEEYKSPYNHGIYPLMDDTSLSDVKDNIADAIYEYRLDQYKDNKRRYEYSQRKKSEAFERNSKEEELGAEKKETDEFTREETDSKQYEFTRGSTSKAKRTKYDKKVEKADKKVRRLQNELPSRKRLKFDKSEKRLKFEKVPLSKTEYLNIRSWGKQAWNSWAVSRRQHRDAVPASMMSNTRKGLRFAGNTYRRWSKAARTIEKHTDPYAKLERAQEKASNYRMQRDRAEYKKMSPDQKKEQREAQREAQRRSQKRMNKKRLQKAVYNKNVVQGNQEFTKNRKLIVKIKDSIVKLVKMAKTFMSMVGTVIFIISIIAALLLGGVYLLLICLQYGGSAVIESTYQADYYQISDCSAYMQKLETDLKERISKIETEEYPDCYEYIYNLGEIRHNSIELMSYLASKFIEFDLETCQEELNSLFEEMYTLIIEIIEEPREREKRDEYGNIIYDEDGNPVTETFMAKICYITLEAKPLDEIAGNRLTVEEKKYYDTYMLSSGGQQVYGACLVENWDKLISSKFGERIHPITGDRTFHNGIDIAVPIGTSLYSSTSGSITTSAYSETAGNYIIVTMENGWSVKYMHLDTRDVSVGEAIVKGQNIGTTGNTGRSTGPHLHLEVRDADDNAIDPTFIIPSRSAAGRR